MGCARRSRRNSRDGGGGRRRSRPRTPPAPPQAAWAPSTWVAAPLVSPMTTREAPSGSPTHFAPHSVRFSPHALGAFPSRTLGAFPSPLWGVRGGGSAIPSQVAPPSSQHHPLPNPPPQGGREQTEIAGTNGGNFSDYITT